MSALQTIPFRKRFVVGASLLLMALALPLCAEPGDLDLTFNGTGKLAVTPSPGYVSGACAIAAQPDGKLVIAGFVGRDQIDPFPESADFAVVRVNANGTLDTHFNGTGIVTTDFDVNDFA
jgi:hypothetical protein